MSDSTTRTISATAIRLDRDGDRATIALCPPEAKPPTLDLDVLGQLESVLDQLEDELPRLVVLTSTTPKYFCVGANVNALRQITAERIGAWVERGHEVLNRLEDLGCPTIARVRGHALGGGLELAMACDLIFADRTAQLGLTEAKLGFIPGWGGCHRLPGRIGAAAAKRLFFTGSTLHADAAARLGLVDLVADAPELDAEIDAFLKQTTGCSPYAIGAFKRILNEQQRTARDRNTAREVELSHGCLNDPGTRQRLKDFLERKKTK